MTLRSKLGPINPDHFENEPGPPKPLDKGQQKMVDEMAAKLKPAAKPKPKE